MVSSFDLEVCGRLPLAEAALRLLDYATADDFLNEVFQRHRGRSYEDSIRFATFVHLIRDALLGHDGSAHQTFRQAQQDQSLQASIQALYGKLRRVPIPLSLGLFSAASARLQQVGSPVVAQPLPPSLAAFWVLGFDGKKLKYVRKMLKALRGLKGNVLGGKLLVVQDLATQQAVAVEAVADGEAADNPLVTPVVERVRALPDQRGRLWVGDRAFGGDFKLLGFLALGEDQFVVRYNSQCTFAPDATLPARTGQDDEGRPYREEWGWLGQPDHPHRLRVRRITVDRGVLEPVILLTSLWDADRYPAVALLTVYRWRWGLETMFQQVVQTFDLRHLIGGTAQATVFQAVLCLLLYNITLLIRDHVAAGAQRPPKTVSSKLLFDDVVRQLTGWMQVLGPEVTLELLRQKPMAEPEALRRWLEHRLAAVWTERWIKAPTRKQPARRVGRAYLCGGHSSVDKIQRGVHKEIPLKPPKTKRPKDRKNPPPHETKKDV